MAKSSATAPDSAYLVLADSAKGYIQWVHEYAIVEAGSSVEARDTLIYKWPYSPSNITVLGHTGSRAHANGSLLRYAITDEDGDKILNEAVAPKPIRLQKLWITVHGDTTWKTIFHTSHGSTTYYDSIGEGSPTSWTDTVFVKGRNIRSQWVKDGDLNGFINTADTGAKPRILRDTYSDLGDGTFRFDFEILGPGADGKFTDEADNERYPGHSLTVDSEGRNVAATKYGDGNGDGFYWNPAAGTHKAWITNIYAPTAAVPTYHDSLEQVLSGTGGSSKKVTYYSADRKYSDGTASRTVTRTAGNAAFSGSDTVQIRELKDFTGYKAKGASDPLSDRDSSLSVTWMIPGDLESPADDKVTLTYAQTWYKAGVSSVSSSELFTPITAYGPGESPKAGTYVLQRRTNPTSSKSVIRTLLFKDFDLSKKVSNWTRTDYFENGDSAVSSGYGSPAGAGVYVQDLGQGARNSGFYDAGSGEFADTVTLLDFKGTEKFRQIAWGTVYAGKGTADYRCKRLGGKDTATAHITVVSDGKAGLIMTREAAAGSSEIILEGDSARTIRTAGGIKQTFTWSSSGAGSYRITQLDESVKTGSAVGTGEYFFGQDLSGNGTWNKTPAGKEAVQSKVQFQSDGTAYVDGVKVSR